MCPDPETMTDGERFSYIFEAQTDSGSDRKDISRFGWLEDIHLGGLLSVRDTVRIYIDCSDNYPDGRSRAGCHFALPAVVVMAQEAISNFYCGATERMLGRRNYRADELVKQFVRRYYPEPYTLLPSLLWDSIRNGILHSFGPKQFDIDGKLVHFSFHCPPPAIPSYVKKTDQGFDIRINTMEFADTFERAFSSYKEELTSDRELQKNFIQAFESLEPRYTLPAVDNPRIAKQREEVRTVEAALQDRDSFALNGDDATLEMFNIRN